MEEQNEKQEKKEGFLVPNEVYLKSGIHIGTRMLNNDMKRFIYKKRDDGIYILDIEKTNDRLKKAASILSKYKPEDILVTASRVYAGMAAEKFAEVCGTDLIKGRFIPGTLTNTKLPNFKEPKILLVSDPRAEAVAVREAAKMNIPVIALCDTDNSVENVDFIIPTNNKGRKALGLVYYLLARSYVASRDGISFDEFKPTLSYFEKLE